MKKIKTIIIDDSILLRTVLSEVLKSDPQIELVGQASDGEEGLKMIKALKPDVVTLDYNMPGWNGIYTLGKIIAQAPCPVIMLSSHTQKDALVTLNALEKGAVDYILKPSEKLSWDVRPVKDSILSKIKSAALVDIANFLELLKVSAQKPAITFKKSSQFELLVIGASTGGPQMLEIILKELPKNFPMPVIIAQHMPGVYTKMFAERLNDISQLEVKESENHEIIESGKAYIVPGDFDMELRIKETDYKTIATTYLTKVNLERTQISPSIDHLMQSIAEGYGKNVIGVLLTGMGTDGALGMKAIHRAEGITIAQSQEDCVIFGMPKEAITLNAVNEVVKGTEIVKKILEITQHHSI